MLTAFRCNREISPRGESAASKGSDFSASCRNRCNHVSVQMRRSDYFVLAAVIISFLLSVYLWFSGQKTEGLFAGLWVPSIVGIAIYFQTIFRR